MLIDANLWARMTAVSLIAAAVAGTVMSALPAAATNPQDTVRAFCRADGRGDRLLPRTWPTIAPIVAWALEPAWDGVSLIEAYELGAPGFENEGTATIEVTYYVVVEVRAGNVIREPRTEKRVYHLVTDDDGSSWRILGPPPPPHVFVSQVDVDGMATSLHPDGGDFLTGAAFVTQFLAGAGWEVPHFATQDVPSLAQLVEVQTPQMGDVVLYYDGEQPYHLGILEEENVVLSATLNGGVRRTPLDAFAGTVRYRRPRIDARKPTGSPTGSPRESSGTPSPELTPAPVATGSVSPPGS